MFCFGGPTTPPPPPPFTKLTVLQHVVVVHLVLLLRRPRLVLERLDARVPVGGQRLAVSRVADGGVQLLLRHLGHGLGPVDFGLLVHLGVGDLGLDRVVGRLHLGGLGFVLF